MLSGLIQAMAWLGLLVLLLAIAAVDLRTHRVPNGLNLTLMLGGLATSAVTGWPGLAASIAGAALGGLFLLGVAVGFRRFRGRDGLGLGDVKFLVAAGAWVGWQGIGPLVFVAASAALVVLGLRAMRGAGVDRHTPIAFAPYLAIGLVLVRAWRQAAVGDPG